ncbi:MAG TPA: hypothetical protein VGE96_00990 [Steroidobacteraceae bacterium]|jgi:hypothetical protein
MRAGARNGTARKTRARETPKEPLKGTVTHIDSQGKKTEFELEAAPVKGEIPERVLDELVQAKTSAKDYASAFADAVKAQAKKYEIKPAALRKYITAREADKLEEVDAELTDLAKLIG